MAHESGLLSIAQVSQRHSFGCDWHWSSSDEFPDDEMSVSSGSEGGPIVSAGVDNELLESVSETCCVFCFSNFRVSPLIIMISFFTSLFCMSRRLAFSFAASPFVIPFCYNRYLRIDSYLGLAKTDCFSYT